MFSYLWLFYILDMLYCSLLICFLHCFSDDAKTSQWSDGRTEKGKFTINVRPVIVTGVYAYLLFICSFPPDVGIKATVYSLFWCNTCDSSENVGWNKPDLNTGFSSSLVFFFFIPKYQCALSATTLSSVYCGDSVHLRFVFTAWIVRNSFSVSFRPGL